MTLTTFYRRQIEGVMMNMLRKDKTKESSRRRPWKLEDKREGKYSFDYAYKVPNGYSFQDLEKQIDALFAACGCIVELEDKAGVVIVSAIPGDFPTKIKLDPAMLTGLGKTEVLLGFTRRMEPVTFDFAKAVNPHLLQAGASGYGKTELMRFLQYQLLRSHRPDELEFWVIDGKGSSGYKPFRKIPNVRISRDMEAAVMMLHDAHELMKERADMVWFDQITPANAKKLKWIVVLIDEAAEFAPSQQVKAYKKLAEECQVYMSNISRIGREPRISLWFCTQRPSHEVFTGQVRANINVKLCFKTENEVQSEIVLGKGNYAAAKLPYNLKGRLIYFDGRNNIIQAPFVGHDKAWDTLLAPFRKDEGHGGNQRPDWDQQRAAATDVVAIDDGGADDRHDAGGEGDRAIPGKPAKKSFRATDGARGTQAGGKSVSGTLQDEDLPVIEKGPGVDGDWGEASDSVYFPED